MSEPINITIRKEIGTRLKKLIEERTKESALRKIDASTGKDHSWIGKVLKGNMNFTIDSLIELVVAYEIELKDVFNFKVDFASIAEKEVEKYKAPIKKEKSRTIPAKKRAIKKAVKRGK